MIHWGDETGLSNQPVYGRSFAPKGKTPAALGSPNIPINVGSRFTIAGIGVTVRGDGKSGGTIRVAGLVATGRPGTLQIRLVDPVGQGTRDGLGACTGVRLSSRTSRAGRLSSGW